MSLAPAENRPEVLLTEELPSSLRVTSTEGSLMADRFHSLQERNLIEVREKRPRGLAGPVMHATQLRCAEMEVAAAFPTWRTHEQRIPQQRRLERCCGTP